MSTTIVYRCPGRHLITNGITFDTWGIDLVDLDKALSEGWHETVPAAIETFTASAAPTESPQVEAVVGEVVEAAAPEAEDNAPPTREEMLAQAALLGLKVDKRWSDETLLAKVNAAMAPAADDPI